MKKIEKNWENQKEIRCIWIYREKLKLIEKYGKSLKYFRKNWKYNWKNLKQLVNRCWKNCSYQKNNYKKYNWKYREKSKTIENIYKSGNN